VCGSITCDHYFSRISELDLRIVTVALNSLVLQNNRNLDPPVSVEVSVREIRPTQQLLPAYRPAYGQTSFYWPDFDFRFLLCPPLFTFLKMSFSRARSSVAFP
jgi:hypothetical protein